MAKAVWHTDIVVDGQGIGLTLRRRRDGCQDLVAMPDVPGAKAKKALAKLKKALAKSPPACTVEESKKKVAKAIKATKSQWNRWHRQTYRK